MYLNEGMVSLSLGNPFEPVETMILKTLVKKGNTVVDLGANVGYYTLLFARQVGEDGRVIAFEPSPTNYEILERNVKINGYKNVKINRLAISSKSGKTRLYMSIHPGDNRIYDKPSDEKKITISNHYIEIETTRLDDYFSEANRNIDFIKMDVQGAECSAIMGMPSILARCRNIKILTEFGPKLLKEFGTDASIFLDQLQDFGFLFYHINNENMKIEITSPNELLRKYTVEKGNYGNLLLTKHPMDDILLMNF